MKLIIKDDEDNQVIERELSSEEVACIKDGLYLVDQSENIQRQISAYH